LALEELKPFTSSSGHSVIAVKAAAVNLFQRSIQLKKDSRGEPEAIVLRCLAEAIIDKATKQERMQKRYKTSMQDRDEKRI
jgi:hypothetical protein